MKQNTAVFLFVHRGNLNLLVHSNIFNIAFLIFEYINNLI